jgi:hypothetical protein
MNINRSNFIHIIKIGAITVIIVLITSFAIWRSYNYIKGPYIEILSPKNLESIDATTTTITGTAYRINTVKINGKPINIDESGNFKETFLLMKGTNRFTISANDLFDRYTKLELDIYRPFPEN